MQPSLLTRMCFAPYLRACMQEQLADCGPHYLNMCTCLQHSCPLKSQRRSVAEEVDGFLVAETTRAMHTQAGST